MPVKVVSIDNRRLDHSHSPVLLVTDIAEIVSASVLHLFLCAPQANLARKNTDNLL